MKIILMRLRITIAMLEIRNRETLQSKVNICKSDVKIGDCVDSLPLPPAHENCLTITETTSNNQTKSQPLPKNHNYLS